jgi:hypothetical protein
MHTIVDPSSIGFDPAVDRVSGVILRRDLRGGLVRERLSAIAHPAWGLPRMAHALERAAGLHLDNSAPTP